MQDRPVQAKASLSFSTVIKKPFLDTRRASSFHSREKIGNENYAVKGVDIARDFGNHNAKMQQTTARKSFNSNSLREDHARAKGQI